MNKTIGVFEAMSWILKFRVTMLEWWSLCLECKVIRCSSSINVQNREIAEDEVFW